jgi:replicative DNA helicase
MQEKKFMQQLQNYFSKIEKEFSEHAFRSILQQLQNDFFKIEKRNKRTCI